MSGGPACNGGGGGGGEHSKVSTGIVGAESNVPNLWALTYGMGPPDPVVNGVLRTPDGATALTQKATP